MFYIWVMWSDQSSISDVELTVEPPLLTFSKIVTRCPSLPSLAARHVPPAPAPMITTCLEPAGLFGVDVEVNDSGVLFLPITLCLSTAELAMTGSCERTLAGILKAQTGKRMSYWEERIPLVRFGPAKVHLPRRWHWGNAQAERGQAATLSRGMT